MRRFILAVFVVLCASCGDSSDIDGPSFKNLLFRVDVTGDPTVAPQTVRLMLDGLYWHSGPVGVDEKLSVPPGDHILTLTGFDNTSVEWCSQGEPGTIQAVFTLRDVVSGHFVLNCPSATGTGILRTALAVQGIQRPGPYTFRLTRTIGITGSLTYQVTPGAVNEQELTAGLYKVELVSGCGRLEPALMIAVRSGQTANLPINMMCAFVLPPGVP